MTTGTDRTTLPDVEVSLLLTTLNEALDLAHVGRQEDGYEELRYGLERGPGRAGGEGAVGR